MAILLYIIGIILSGIGGFFFSFSEETSLIGLGLIIVGLGVVCIGMFCGKKNPKKRRSEFRIPLKCSVQEANGILNSILPKHKFHMVNYGKEKVLQSGDGFWTARKFLKISFEDEMLVMEAWISAGLGSKPNTEYPLDGKFVAAVPKQQLQKVVNEIQAKMS